MPTLLTHRLWMRQLRQGSLQPKALPWTQPAEIVDTTTATGSDVKVSACSAGGGASGGATPPSTCVPTITAPLVKIYYFRSLRNALVLKHSVCDAICCEHWRVCDAFRGHF